MSLSHVCKSSVNHALKVAYGYVSILSKADIEIEVIAQQSSMELSNITSTNFKNVFAKPSLKLGSDEQLDLTVIFLWM